MRRFKKNSEILPGYLSLLKKRAEEAKEILANCTLCPRECGVNRLKGERGFCQAGERVKISTALAHFGEEPPLSGKRGSGAIFFTHCNMRCLFCQNYQISQQMLGTEYSPEELSGMMLDLQSQGCHNINMVSPTHYVPQILESLLIAAKKGLKIPLVYNTNGYDSINTLRLLDGIIDIYLPDMKYADEKLAMEFSSAPLYPHHNQNTIVEMFRQVGNLVLDKEGVAQRGLIVRHLVLPGQLSNTYTCLSFLLCFISQKVTLSLMSQYEPRFKAATKPGLDRRITIEEYRQARKWAEEFGFENCLIQDLASPSHYLPDFTNPKPFES